MHQYVQAKHQKDYQDCYSNTCGLPLSCPSFSSGLDSSTNFIQTSESLYPPYPFTLSLFLNNETLEKFKKKKKTV